MCGLRSLRDQMRCTEVADTPACFAIVRRLQRVLGFGGRVASVMTRATLASGSEGRRPRPVSSSRPSKPCCSNRFVHVETRLRSEEHTSELQSQSNLVCRLLLETKT